MVKKIITLSIILLVFLAACQSTPASPTALPEEQVQPGQSDGVTPSLELPPLPVVSPTPANDPPARQDEVNCTVVSREPTPGPTEQSLIPPVNETDWVHGPEDAKVTIIEYGDFQ
jgi:hypothetical protein